MKKISLVFCLLFSLAFYGQTTTVTINGEALELKTEVEGELDLLWNIIDSEYRFFVRSADGTITQLKSTRNDDNKYQYEYKSTLEQLTKDQNLSADKVKLTLPSLRDYLDSYNQLKNSDYTSAFSKSGLSTRLGISGGLTNNPFVGNPDNKKTALVVAELEVFENNIGDRHAGFIQARKTFESDDFQYALTEFSLGYRYRLVKSNSFSLYGQVKFATLGFSDATFIDSEDMEQSLNETSFDVPFIFGIGADFKVSDNSYITLIYGELFAALLDNQGNFSTDIAIGYKFNL
ncbi:MAG: hypothetical protein HKP28_06840 [Winogradskyella sp.]|nr:hypothetical protein [Winogradskyella sp.]